jgi:sterol-4alpha-carboxylate 3-dehydrogenase (decarboxylating)
MMDKTKLKPYYEDDFQTCLVIGGAGMLGYVLAEGLYTEGKTVRVMDIQPVDDERFESWVGDIRVPGDLRAAMQGVDIVFQCAAAVWDPKLPAQVYEEVNIQGNRNVIDACLEVGIPKIVYTSTIDVVVDGTKPITNGDESLPYPDPLPKDPYCRTKITAEVMMCEASSETLKICTLRPAMLYGPRDKYHLPNLIKAARMPLNFRLGDGSACFSHMFTENAAHAHILAAKHLGNGSPLEGRFYFIADAETNVNMFDFVEPFLIELGYRPPKMRIPYRLAYALSWITEKINPHATFVPFAVIQTCLDHTYSYKKAEAHFGYQPVVGKEDAFRKTVVWFKNNPI